jgi:hypothetical protein
MMRMVVMMETIGLHQDVPTVLVVSGGGGGGYSR